MDSELVKSGFLIVKTFRKLYHDYVGRFPYQQELYAIPHIDKNPDQFTIQYSGLDRDALRDYEWQGVNGWKKTRLEFNAPDAVLSEIRLAELAKEGKCSHGFLFDYQDAQDALNYLKNKQDYEIIWTRIAGMDEKPPRDYTSIGFEPTYFTGDHFSPHCDCMFIPRWHGTDNDGTLFSEYFHKLNIYGLFTSPKDAQFFVHYYLSFDWTEHSGDCKIAEVFTHNQQPTKLRMFNDIQFWYRYWRDNHVIIEGV